MKDYHNIKQTCIQNSKISAKVVDEFIMYYAADKDKLHKRVMIQLGKYKEVFFEIGEETTNRIVAQYIVHQVFKEKGLIKKYLQHSAVKNLLPIEYAFLVEQAKVPWKYRFSKIIGNPAPDFFEMYDVFREEEFLLYSPGTTLTFETQAPILWFNLTGYNGDCWATFGPIAGYNGFDEDDVFFFATELNLAIENADDLTEALEFNPIPFAALFCGANIPRVQNAHTKTEILFHSAIDDMVQLDTERLKEHFTLSWNRHVYQLKLKQYSEVPHAAIAYYDEQNKLLQRTALTAFGFDALSHALQHLPIENLSDVVVSLPMKSTTEHILKKKIELNPYEYLFEEKVDDSSKDALKTVNNFIQLLLPYVNNGQEPNLQEMAQKANLTLGEAQKLWNMLGKYKR